MKEHTKGPWDSVQGSTTGRTVIATASTKARRNVAHVGGPDREANARLIAAAPDLLEALKIMTGLVLIKYGNLHEDVNAEIAKADAAIVKAGA